MCPSRAEKLGGLAQEICRCVRCPLHQSRTRAVPGEGDAHADVMIVGEAPGKKEDEQGRPFVGRSGKMLDEMLERAGLQRQKVYITSSVKCRPPNNRTPHVKELRTCKENWLLRQIELIDPKLVVLLGRVAIRQVLEENISVSKAHGEVRENHGRRCLLTFHPAAALRMRGLRARLRGDIERIPDLVQ